MLSKEYENVTLGMLTRCLDGVDVASFTATLKFSDPLNSLVFLAKATGRLKVAVDHTTVEKLYMEGGTTVVRVHQSGRETYSVYLPTEKDTEETMAKLQDKHGGWL